MRSLGSLLTLTMKSLWEAIHLHNRLIANLEEAQLRRRCAPLLSVVVGGLSSFEGDPADG